MPSKYNPDKHHRQSIRLKGHDYAQAGAYFITICTHNRNHVFGKIVDGTVRLNRLGKMTQQCWRDIPQHFPHVRLDAYVVMPNHVHGIITIDGTSKTIGSIVRGFKIGATKWARQNTDIPTIWQRNYYEHIIRNESDLQRIRQYIIQNPMKWESDNLF